MGLVSQNEQIKSLWEQFLQEINYNNLSGLSQTFLKRLQIKEDGKVLLLNFPDEITKLWFYQNYFDIFKKIFNKWEKIELIILRKEEKEEKKEKKEKESTAFDEENIPTFYIPGKKVDADSIGDDFFGIKWLNPKYTLERFVVGQENELAYSSINVTLSAPGRLFNPIFIYGGVGLGKTHLLQAVAREFIIKRRTLKVAYLSSEDFTNAFVKAIQQNKIHEFRVKMRSLDVLIIDDVQFFKFKTQTLEELFHTFNKLFHEGKQLIFSSDKPPKELEGIEERIRDRFKSGLLAEILPPGEELRKKILLVKAGELGIKIPEDILEFLVQNIQGSVRNLESAINYIYFIRHKKGKYPTIEEMYQWLIKDKNSVDEKPKADTTNAQSSNVKMNVEKILDIITQYYQIKKEEILNGNKTQKVSKARQVAMYFLKTYTNLSLTDIGKIFGGRSHTTVIKAFQKIDNLINTDEELKREIEILKSRFHHIREENREKEELF